VGSGEGGIWSVTELGPVSESIGEDRPRIGGWQIGVSTSAYPRDLPLSRTTWRTTSTSLRQSPRQRVNGDPSAQSIASRSVRNSGFRSVSPLVGI
jgi:hypothetical protein